MLPLKQQIQRQKEKKLVKKARNGDARAFEALIKIYQRPVYLCIVGMISSHHATDDLIQETFIKAFNNLHRFDENYPFYPWIRQIAVNTTLNFIKSESIRRHTNLDELNETGHSPIAEDDPAKDMERSEMMHRVRQALATLPAEQRMVFSLRTYEEMSYEEIAQALDISIGTVMSRLNRAREKLKKQLQDYIG